MEEKNKNENEKIVRLDDSGNEIEPPENSLGVDKDEFYQLLAEVWNRKMGGRGALSIAEMIKEADDELNKYIEPKVNAIKVRGEEASERDIQRLKIYWYEKKIQDLDNQIINTKSDVKRLRLEDLREYLRNHLERLKKHASTQPVMALYTHCIDENLRGKKAEVMQRGIQLGWNGESFYKYFKDIGTRNEKDPCKKQSNFTEVEKLIEEYEGNKSEAINELNRLKKVYSKP